MRKPKAVRIKRRWIKINYTTELIDGKDVGEFDPTTTPMTITVVLNKDWKSTLWHELLHAYLNLNGLSRNMTKNYEETLVEIIERSSIKMLKFNWKFRGFRY